MSGTLFKNLPGWDDIRYMVGLYEEEDSTVIFAEHEEPVAVSDVKEVSTEVWDLGYPTKIIINSVNIELPVELGRYDADAQSWTISKGKAFWAELSSLPYEEGSNTVIYAHNQWTEFFKTKNLEVGDKIIVETDKGNILTYEYNSDELVDPSWGALFSQEVETSRLTLITCNGANDEHRRLIFADLMFASLSDEFIASREESFKEDSVKVEDPEPVEELPSESTIQEPTPIVEEPIVEEDVVVEAEVEELVWEKILLNEVVYGRPTSISIEDLNLFSNLQLGQLSTSEIISSNVNNAGLALASDSAFVGDEGAIIVYAELGEQLWKDLQIGSRFTLKTHVNQKLVFKINGNEIMSDSDLNYNLHTAENGSVNIVIKENEGLRLVTASCYEAYTLL